MIPTQENGTIELDIVDCHIFNMPPTNDNVPSAFPFVVTLVKMVVVSLSVA